MVWPQRKTLQLKYRVSAAKYPITVSLLVKANFKKKYPHYFFSRCYFDFTLEFASSASVDG